MNTPRKKEHEPAVRSGNAEIMMGFKPRDIEQKLNGSSPLPRFDIRCSIFDICSSTFDFPFFEA